MEVLDHRICLQEVFILHGNVSLVYIGCYHRKKSKEQACKSSTSITSQEPSLLLLYALDAHVKTP